MPSPKPSAGGPVRVLVGTRLPLAVELGRRLHAARAQAGLTQRALASRVACAVGYVSLVERGERQPSLALVLAWAAACTSPAGPMSAAALLQGIEATIGVRKVRI